MPRVFLESRKRVMQFALILAHILDILEMRDNTGTGTILLSAFGFARILVLYQCGAVVSALLNLL